MQYSKPSGSPVHTQYGRPEMSTHGLGQRLVERHGGVGEAADATLVSEGLLQSLAEHDGDVFDGVVRVDVGVPGGFDCVRSISECLPSAVIMWL